jgi:hypothetical protein
MKLKPTRDWIAKILSLLLAIGIWFLIKGHLGTLPNSDGTNGVPPKAIPVDEKALPKRNR